MRKLFTILFLFSLTAFGQTTRQVANSGAPYTSIQAAIDASTSGDIVEVKRGDTFYDSVQLKSGVTLRAYGTGSLPVVSGFKILSGWVSVGSGIYEADMSEGTGMVKSLTINGAFKNKGRLPKTGTLMSIIDAASFNETTVTITDATLSGLDLYGAYVGYNDNYWDFWINKITHHVGSTITAGKTNAYENTSTGKRFAVLNHPQLCTEFGEWYYNDSTKKIGVYFGSATPSDYVIKASKIHNVLNVTNLTTSTIENIQIEGANEHGVYGTGTVTLTGCTFKSIGRAAVSTVGTLNVSNSLIQDIGTYGIAFNGTTTITGNTLERIGQIPGQAESGQTGDGIIGVGGQFTTATVSNNNISFVGYCGVRMYYPKVHTIASNVVHDINLVNEDGSGLYINGNQGVYRYDPACLWENNIIYNTTENGMYLDDGANNVTVRNNTVYNCGNGILSNDGSYNTVYANTFYRNASNQIATVSKSTDDQWYNVFKKNIAIARGSANLVLSSIGIDGVEKVPVYDSNTYRNDINTIPFIYAYFGLHPTGFAQWQTRTDIPVRPYGENYDLNSSYSVIPDGTFDTLLVNPTSAPQVHTLGFTGYEVVTNTAYTEVTLQPKTSMVLFTTYINQAPTVNVGENQTWNYTFNAASANASASDDGTIETYLWTQQSGPNTANIVSPGSAETSFTGLIPGVYTFRCTVTDNDGATAFDELTITITANTNPTANAGSDVTITLPTNSVNLTGSGSDAETSFGYTWSRLSGPNTPTIADPNAANTTVSGLIQGTYVFQLVTTDGGGLTGTDTKTVIVNAAGVTPTSRAITLQAHHTGIPGQRFKIMRPGEDEEESQGNVIVDNSMDVDEFIGPLAGWTLAQANGVPADGVTDAAPALNALLDSLGYFESNTVLYLEPGTYRILSGLKHRSGNTYPLNHEAVTIVGANPLTTTIIYDGPAHADSIMLHNIGVSYSKVSRITWDANNKAGTIIDDSRCNNGVQMNTGNEYSDNIFKDATVAAIKGGAGSLGCLALGFSEVTLKHNRFYNCAKGYWGMNPNALDIWGTRNYFYKCGVAYTNQDGGAGNWHSYGDFFDSTLYQDVRVDAVEGFSIREAYSRGSGSFLSLGFSNNTCQAIVQRCKVIGNEGAAIVALNEGPLTLIDNVFLPKYTHPFVYQYGTPTLFTMGNKWLSGHVQYSYGEGEQRLTGVNDTVITRSYADTVAPMIAPFQPNYNRRIFEVNNSMTTAQIQDSINAAHALNNKAVVHFKWGQYSLSRQLRVSANSNVQTVGDGYRSWLQSNTADSAAVVIYGPTKSTLKALKATAPSGGYGIVAENVDQAGALIYSSRFEGRKTDSAIVFVDGLINANTTFTNAGIVTTTNPQVTARGVIVKGNGSPATNKTVFYGVLSNETFNTWNFTNSSNGLLFDNWAEFNAGKFYYAYLTGSSNLSISGARVMAYRDTIPTDTSIIRLHNFNGKYAGLSTNYTGRVTVTGTGTGQGLQMSTYISDTPYFVNTSSGIDFRAINNRRNKFNSGYTSLDLPNFGTADPNVVSEGDKTFILSLLEPIRNQRVPRLATTAAGVTDWRIFDVWTEGGKYGLWIKGY